MATRNLTRADFQGGAVFTWTGLLNGDDGSAFQANEFGDRSIQFLGTFGVGGTVILEGSNNGTDWAALADPQGNAVSKTAAAIEQILEATRFVRPRVTAGDGTTALTAVLYARRSTR